jgi:hypothetical protein
MGKGYMVLGDEFFSFLKKTWMRKRYGIATNTIDTCARAWYKMPPIPAHGN